MILAIHIPKFYQISSSNKIPYPPTYQIFEVLLQGRYIELYFWLVKVSLFVFSQAG